MKAGDIVEWRGKNGTVRGMVTESEQGGLHVKTGDGRSFPLRDLRLAKSFRIANEVDRT